MQPVTKQQQSLPGLAFTAFFFIVKLITVGLLFLIIVLGVSQSAVAPVSTQLVGSYVLQYTIKAVKPYKIFFPKPYMVNLD